MSEAMKRIVQAYMRVGNLPALEELRSHRKGILDGLRSVKDFHVTTQIKQNEEELAIVEEGISCLA
jgi:hypothetical protein